MKKKTVFLGLVAAAVLFVGCAAADEDVKIIEKDPVAAAAESNSEKEEEQQNTESDTSGAETASVESTDIKGYVFDYNGIKLTADMNMKQVLDSLGEPLSYFEATSCAFEGLDKTYTYADFEIVTYPQGDDDLINSIYLLNNIVTTAEGIYIGSDRASVEAAYGSDYTETGSEMIYEKDGMQLRFIMADGKVTSITYASKALQN